MAELTDFVQKNLDYRVRNQKKFVETNSGWIGSVPSDWSVMKLARCLESQVTGSREKYDGDDGVLSVGGEHITDRGGLEIEEDIFISNEFYRSLNDGQIRAEDVLLIKDGATIGKTAYVDEVPDGKAAVNSHVYILRGREFCSNRFLYYVIDSEIVQEQIQVQITGSAQEGLSTKFSKFVEVPMPPYEEQKAIVNFLDKTISRINKLIDEKEKLLHLLDEKRSVLITQAVTQGLGTDVVLEDSGVPGLGKIPEDWDTAPLKYSSRNVTVGIVQKPSQYYVDEGVPALRSMNVRQNEVVDDELVYISEEDNKSLKGSQIYSGDLVCVRSGVNASTTAVVPDRLDGVNCIDLIIIRRPEGYVPEFLSYLMNSSASTSQIEAGTEGAAVQHFNVEEVKELVFPKPDLDEQREILDWLSPRLREMDETKTKIQESIERLKEYRTALITEAVTGQIDVRGEV